MIEWEANLVPPRERNALTHRQIETLAIQTANVAHAETIHVSDELHCRRVSQDYQLVWNIQVACA